MKELAMVWAVAGLILAGAVPARALTTTGWTENVAENPVYQPAKAYYPSVLSNVGIGGTNYNFGMWYDTGSTIGVATSTDGASDWTVHAGSPVLTGRHPHIESFPEFTGSNSGNNPSDANMTYRIWTITGSTATSLAAFRYAESPDGLNWYNEQQIQQAGASDVSIIDGTGWNTRAAGVSDIIYNPSGDASIYTGADDHLDPGEIFQNKFVIYWSANGNTQANAPWVESLGLAVSADGITWHAYDKPGDGSEPVFGGGTASKTGAWDSWYAGWAGVEDDRAGASGLMHLWYSGGQDRIWEGLGHASSTDGINWTKSAENPFLSKDDIPLPAYRNDPRSYAVCVIDDMLWFGTKGGGSYGIGLLRGAGGGPEPIPEPGALGLLSLGLAGMVRRRRR